MLNRMCKSKQEVQKAKATTKSNPKRDTQSPKIDADKSKASKGTKNNSFKTHKKSIVIKRNQNLSTIYIYIYIILEYSYLDLPLHQSYHQ